MQKNGFAVFLQLGMGRFKLTDAAISGKIQQVQILLLITVWVSFRLTGIFPKLRIGAIRSFAA